MESHEHWSELKIILIAIASTSFEKKNSPSKIERYYAWNNKQAMRPNLFRQLLMLRDFFLSRIQAKEFQQSFPAQKIGAKYLVGNGLRSNADKLASSVLFLLIHFTNDFEAAPFHCNKKGRFCKSAATCIIIYRWNVKSLLFLKSDMVCSIW